MAKLGDRIKATREKLGLTQKDYAEKIGVEKSTIASWELGRREPDLDSLVKIAAMTGVSLDWLAGRYDYGIEKARAYNSPCWREVIDAAADGNIGPEQLKPIVTAIAAIKKS